MESVYDQYGEEKDQKNFFKNSTRRASLSGSGTKRQGMTTKLLVMTLLGQFYLVTKQSFSTIKRYDLKLLGYKVDLTW